MTKLLTDDLQRIGAAESPLELPHPLLGIAVALIPYSE